MFKKQIFILAALFIALVPMWAKADLFDTYGFNAQGIAMGQARSAGVDNLSAVYYNPAGLADVKGHALGFSYLYNSANMDIGGALTAPPDDDEIGGGTAVLSLGIDLNKIMNLPRNACFALGMSMQDDGTMIQLEDLEEDRYAYISYGPAISRTAIYTALGFEISDTLSMGLGVHIMIGGEVAATMTLNADDLSTTQAVTPSRQNFWMKMKVKPYPIAGLKFKPTPNLTFGFCYRDGIEVDMDPFLADLALNLGSYAAHIKAYTAILSFWQPATFQSGCEYRLGNLSMEADLSYALWSDFIQSAPRELRRYTPEFDNVIRYHLGLQYRMDNKRIWAGYQYSPTPLPDEMQGAHYLDADRHIVSAGAGISVPDPFGIFRNPPDISLALQDQILPEKRFSSAGDDYSLKGNIISVATSISLAF